MKMKIDNIPVCCKILAAVIVICGTGFFCSSQPTHTNGGSGTEAPNALILISDSGRLYGTSHLVVVAGAYDSMYVPYNDSGFDTLIPGDSNGRFNFGALKTGTYNVVVTEADSGKAAFFSGIRVEPGIGPDTFRSVLDAVGSVSGYVKDSSGRIYPMLPVYFLGSPFFDRADTSGFFSIQQAPAGIFYLLTKRIILTPQGQAIKDTLMADTLCGIAVGESKSVGVLMLKE
jgi:hypothetical protein